MFENCSMLTVFYVALQRQNRDNMCARMLGEWCRYDAAGFKSTG